MVLIQIGMRVCNKARVIKIKIYQPLQEMSYYDPFFPSIEATRLEIQRSFLALEEKLRLQREMDLGLTNLDLRPYAFAEEHEHFNRHVINANNYATHVYDREISDRIKYAREEEASSLRYFSKMEQLERERLQLSRERASSTLENVRARDLSRSPYKVISHEGNEEDQSLVKKYEDGTRARELQADMIHNRDRFNSLAVNSSKGRDNGNLDRTPYHNLSHEGANHNRFSNEKLNKFLQEDRSGNKKMLSKAGQRAEDPQDKKYKEPHFGNIDLLSNAPPVSEDNSGRNNSGLASGTPTKMRESSKSNNELHSSPYRSYLEPNPPDRSLKQKQSATKKNRNPADRSRKLSPPETSAMEKIQKRLKLSHIVYKDSKFKNIKHELSHLFNTYDCEFRLRRELKDKINCHPLVLKKHAMVVE